MSNINVNSSTMLLFPLHGSNFINALWDWQKLLLLLRKHFYQAFSCLNLCNISENKQFMHFMILYDTFIIQLYIHAFILNLCALLCPCQYFAYPVGGRRGGGHTRGFRQKTIFDMREFDKLKESGSWVIDLGRFLNPRTRCTKQAQGWRFRQKWLSLGWWFRLLTLKDVKFPWVSPPLLWAGKIMTGALHTWPCFLTSNTKLSLESHTLVFSRPR